MNFNALDLNLIRVFDAVMHERSVTCAGDRIGLSQPAVSSALNRLRHIFNDSLFVRQGNEMVPTPLAQEMANRASTALAEIQSMIEVVSGCEIQQLSRTFSLLSADFFSMLLMPHLASKVHAQAPRLKLRLLDSACGNVARLLQESTIDMALERPLDVPDWISSTLLFRSPFIIIGSRQNRLLDDVEDGQMLPMSLFSELPHVIRSIDGSMSGMIDDALATHGLKRNVVLALPHFHAVTLAVAVGGYIAAVPVQFANAVGGDLGLRCFKPPIDVPVPDVNLYWHSRYDDDRAHQWMRGQVIEAVEELGFSTD